MDPDTSPSSSSSSPVVSYLINSCGLSEDRAVSICKKLPSTTTISYLETIVTTLESHGFTKPHISKIIIKTPRFLEPGRCGHLEQKLDYFKSKEISSLEFVKFLTSSPEILIRGLKDKIIPLFDFIKSIVCTDRDTFKVIGNTFNDMRCLTVELIQERISGNVQVLRDEGIPERVIVNFLTQLPKVCLISTDKFKGRVQDVKDMGVNPHKTPSGFVSWIRMLVFCSKTTLEAKMNVLREWGWPEDQLQDAVLKYPGYMTRSIAKIEAILDYLVTQMGYSISSFLKHLGVFSFSLEKRIIPRISVHRFLISKGLIKCNGSLGGVLNITDEKFLKKFVTAYKVEAPELLQIYNQPSIGRVTGDSQSEEVTILKERVTESVGALPEVAKLVDENDAGKAKEKASLSDLVEPEEELDKEKEPMKARKPRKILKKSEKKVDKVLGGAAKEKEGHHNIEFDEEKKDKSKEEEEIVVVPIVEGGLASGLKRKVTLDKEEYPKKVKKLRKVLKKSKEKVEEVQGDAAKKEEEDKSKEEEEIVVVPMVKESKNAKRSKKKFVNKDDAETPELLQVHNQASISCVMEDSESEEVTNCPEREIESAGALPKVAELADENDAGKPTKKASSSDLVEPEEGLDKEKEPMKARKPRKILKKSEKKVDKVQGGAAKEKGGHHYIEFDEEKKNMSKEEEEIVVDSIVEKVLEGSFASGLKRKVALDKEENPKKVKKPRKVLKKSKKKVEEVQDDAAKKEEEDKSKEEEEIVVVHRVEESKIAKRPKKKFLNKDDVETPELLQVSNMRANEDSQSEEVTFCPEMATESVEPLPRVAEVVGKLKKKASSSDLVEKGEESKTAKKPRKILKRSKQKVEELQDGTLMKEKRGQSNTEFDGEEKDKCDEEKEIVAVPMGGRVLEGSQVIALKRKITLDTGEDFKKIKKPKKVLKKSKKKSEEVLGVARKNEEEDKSKEEKEIVVIPMDENASEGSQASLLMRKVVLDKAQESHKVKKPKKVSKKAKKKIEELQGSAKKEEMDKGKEVKEIADIPLVKNVFEDSQGSVPIKVASVTVEELKNAKRLKKKLVIKDDVKTSELLQVSIMRANEDSQSEEVTFCPERATESVAPLPKVAEVVDKNQVGKLKKKASSSDLVEQEEELEKGEESKTAKNPRKIPKRSNQKVEELQDGTLMKEKRGHSNTEFDGEEKDKCEEEKEIVAVPMGGRVLEGSQVSALKRKITLDTGEDFKKIKKPKKVLKTCKKKSEEVLGDAGKNEEEDKSKEEKEIVVIPMDENASEHSQASLLMRKVVLDKAQESHKVKKPKKVPKKAKKKIEELQGSAKKEEMDKGKEVKEIADIPLVKNLFEDSQGSVPIKVASVTVEESKIAKRPKKKFLNKDDVETPELLQASNIRAKEDSQIEEVTMCQERATESVVALPKVTKVVDKSEAGKHKKKASSRDLVEQEEELEKEEESRTSKNPTNILKRSKKKVEEVQGAVKLIGKLQDRTVVLKKGRKEEELFEFNTDNGKVIDGWI